jgi:hypothetical protein
MAFARPFAYNLGTTIPGTEQVGELSIGAPTSGFTNNPQYWNGPDEELGYIIAQSVSGNTQPTPLSGVTASVGFFRSEDLTEGSFITLSETIANQSFANGDEAKTWLNNNGYWTSYESLPSPSPTPTGTSVTETPTPTNTPTETEVLTPTPTETETPTPTPTPTNTETPTNTPTTTSTPTPTPTSGATGDFTVTVSQVGSDVVWNGSGSFNTTSLISNGTDELTAGFSAPNAAWAIGDPTPPGPTLDIYSGVTTFPTSFGTAGGPIGTPSGSGDTFGILPNGSNRNLLVPTGYTSGSFISGTTIYAGATIAGMNLIPGTYTWAWGSGGTASSLVMTIESAGVTPTPTPTPTETEVLTPTPTETETPTPTPTETEVLTPTPTETETPTPTPTETEVLTPTPTETETPTPTPTPTETEVLTPTPTETETPTPTPTPTPTSGATTDGWLIYYPEGPISVGPPVNDGNTVFLSNPGTIGVYNPNYTGGTLELYFNENNSVGTSYLTQFQGLDTNGGTLTISQGSNTVIYSGSPAQYNLALPDGFLVLQVSNISQMIQSASTPFVSGTTINVVVN